MLDYVKLKTSYTFSFFFLFNYVVAASSLFFFIVFFSFGQCYSFDKYSDHQLLISSFVTGSSCCDNCIKGSRFSWKRWSYFRVLPWGFHTGLPFPLSSFHLSACWLHLAITSYFKVINLSIEWYFLSEHACLLPEEFFYHMFLYLSIYIPHVIFMCKIFINDGISMSLIIDHVLEMFFVFCLELLILLTIGFDLYCLYSFQGLLVYGRQGRKIFKRNLDPDVCREVIYLILGIIACSHGIKFLLHLLPYFMFKKKRKFGVKHDDSFKGSWWSFEPTLWAVMHSSKFGVIYWKQKRETAVQNLGKLIYMSILCSFWGNEPHSIQENHWLSLTSFW